MSSQLVGFPSMAAPLPKHGSITPSTDVRLSSAQKYDTHHGTAGHCIPPARSGAHIWSGLGTKLPATVIAKARHKCVTLCDKHVALCCPAGFRAKERLVEVLGDRFMPSFVGSRFCIAATSDA